MACKSGKIADNFVALILLFLIAFGFAISAHAAEKKAEKKKETREAVVLMPLRPTKDIPQDEMTQYEVALKKGLSERYVVYSGEQVQNIVKDVYRKRSGEAKAGHECDETKCIQDIAMAFQTELVAIANIRKTGGGYSISLTINNVMDDKSVFSNQIPCERCNEFEVARQLKTLLGGAAPADVPAPDGVLATIKPAPKKEAAAPPSYVQISLGSNIDADFYVDDAHVGTGRQLNVHVDVSKAHKLSAKAENYKEKIEYVQANERREAVGFVFLDGDAISKPDVAASKSSKNNGEITLHCNENATFYVDGVKVGTGKTVLAQVDGSAPHAVLVKADGYVSKEEYIKPPYNPKFPFEFYYMIGDKEN